MSFRTHPVSRSHMLVKQIHILHTVSQDMLRGRSEHVLHDLQSRPSLIIKAFQGSCVQGQLWKSHKVHAHFLLLVCRDYVMISVHLFIQDAHVKEIDIDNAMKPVTSRQWRQKHSLPWWDPPRTLWRRLLPPPCRTQLGGVCFGSFQHGRLAQMCRHEKKLCREYKWWDMLIIVCLCTAYLQVKLMMRVISPWHHFQMKLPGHREEGWYREEVLILHMLWARRLWKKAEGFSF